MLTNVWHPAVLLDPATSLAESEWRPCSGATSFPCCPLPPQTPFSFPPTCLLPDWPMPCIYRPSSAALNLLPPGKTHSHCSLEHRICMSNFQHSLACSQKIACSHLLVHPWEWLRNSPLQLHRVQQATLLKGWEEGVQDHTGVVPLCAVPQPLEHQLRLHLHDVSLSEALDRQRDRRREFLCLRVLQRDQAQRAVLPMLPCSLLQTNLSNEEDLAATPCLALLAISMGMGRNESAVGRHSLLPTSAPDVLMPGLGVH